MAGTGRPELAARALPSSLRHRSSAASVWWIRATTRPPAMASSTLVLPNVASPALLASAKAESAASASSRSTIAGSSWGTLASALKERAKTLRFTASATTSRAAVSHSPRPGNRSLRSGTTVPSGARTKRISASRCRQARVKAHVRPCASASSRLSVRSAASCRNYGLLATSSVARAASGFLGRGLAIAGGALLTLGRRRRKIGFGDPSRLDAGREDHVLDLVLAETEFVENALVADGLFVLALAPAGEVVGGAIGQVLDRLDVVLAERDEHRRRDPWDLGKLIGDAERFALGVELRFQFLQMLERARLNFGRGV